MTYFLLRGLYFTTKFTEDALREHKGGIEIFSWENYSTTEFTETMEKTQRDFGNSS